MQPGLYLIVGDEYRVAARAAEMVASLVPAAARVTGCDMVDGAVDTVDAAIKAIGRCEQALNSGGLFAERRLVWLRNATFPEAKNLARSADLKARLAVFAEFLKRPLPAGASFLLTAPGLDKRSALYKVFDARKAVQEFAVPESSYRAEAEARAFAAATFKQAGLRIGADAFNAFCERVGTDSRTLVSEVGKLSVYLGERKEVVSEDVQAITSQAREDAGWDLADAMCKHDVRRSVALVEQLLYQRGSHIGLIVTIENRLRETATIKAGMEEGWIGYRRGSDGRGWAEGREASGDVGSILGEELASDPRKINAYRLAILAGQAAPYASGVWIAALRRALETHRTMVTRGLPPAHALESLAIRLMA